MKIYCARDIQEGYPFDKFVGKDVWIYVYTRVYGVIEETAFIRILKKGNLYGNPSYMINKLQLSSAGWNRDYVKGTWDKRACTFYCTEEVKQQVLDRRYNSPRYKGNRSRYKIGKNNLILTTDELFTVEGQ